MKKNIPFVLAKRILVFTTQESDIKKNWTWGCIYKDAIHKEDSECHRQGDTQCVDPRSSPNKHKHKHISTTTQKNMVVWVECLSYITNKQTITYSKQYATHLSLKDSFIPADIAWTGMAGSRVSEVASFLFIFQSSDSNEQVSVASFPNTKKINTRLKARQERIVYDFYFWSVAALVCTVCHKKVERLITYAFRKGSIFERRGIWTLKRGLRVNQKTLRTPFCVAVRNSRPTTFLKKTYER